MTISTSVRTRNSSSAVSLISFFSSWISALLPLKSKRLASSFLAWLTAFSISIELTCETMSNEGMAEKYADGWKRKAGIAPHAYTSKCMSSGRLFEMCRITFPCNRLIKPFRSGAPTIRCDTPIVAAMSTIVSATESLTA